MNGAKRRYRENKVYQLRVDLYRNTDATLISYLDKAWSKAAFVKKACLRDIPRVVTIKQGKYYCPACNRAYTPVQDSYSYCPYCGTHIIHFDLYTAEATPEASADAYTAVDTPEASTDAYTAVDTPEATPEASADAYTAVDTPEASTDAYTAVDTPEASTDAYTAVDTPEATPEASADAYTAVDTGSAYTAVDTAEYEIDFVIKKGGERHLKTSVYARNQREAIKIFRAIYKEREKTEGHAFRPVAKLITKSKEK